jgi:hypothetical protein
MLPTKFRVLYKDCSFRPDPLQTWPPQAILVSDWLIFLDSSPLKPFGQMNRNLVGSMDEISTLYRGLPIDASYQFSVHLAKRF